MIENTIICADVIEGLNQIPDSTVTLAINSPPYNLNIDYDQASDDQPYAEYVKWLESVYKNVYRTLRKGGRLIINIDAMTNRQEDKDQEYFRDIRTDLANVLKPMGFRFFGEHIWYKTDKPPFNGNCPKCKQEISVSGSQFCGKKTAWGSYMSPSTPAVRRNHEYILVYSKEQFKLEKDANSRDPDITGEEFQQFIASTWNMQPETRNLGNHPVPFPMALPYKAIKLYSYPGDLVIDPFNGIGTTTLVAYQTKRRYIGIDMDSGYCEYARERITARPDLFSE